MSTHCYINKQNRELYVWMIFRVLEVIHITYNTGNCDLSDIYALSPQGLWPAEFKHTYRIAGEFGELTLFEPLAKGSLAN